MEAFLSHAVEAFIGWFSLPRNGLASLFAVAFVSATLLPMGSEPAVFGYVKLNPQDLWIAVIVATAGNTLGGLVTWWMGLKAQQLSGAQQSRYVRWFARLGPKALILAWLPVVGDPLCAVAGWLKLPFWPCAGWMALGKFLRYVAMTGALLWVPDGFWAGTARLLSQAFSMLAQMLGLR
jgi:membrane protein YqaA with SNARE-associated domain